MEIIHTGRNKFIPPICSCAACIECAQGLSGRQAAVAITPPSKRTIVMERPGWRHNSPDYIRLEFPWITTIFTYKNTYNSRKYPYFTNQYIVLGSNERPNSLDTPVYPLPLPNTSPNGVVCLGSIGSIVESDLKTISDKLIEIYFSTSFAPKSGFKNESGNDLTSDDYRSNPLILLNRPETHRLSDFVTDDPS